jgi:23S rRNA (adenine2503-C2)-methyltransferase
VTNVVFMGMGEPLANYRNVVPVAKLLVDDRAFGLSRRRVTISTVGLVPQLLRLAEECNVALAVSLHAPTDELRNRLVPINRIHPIAELLDACWRYAECLASRQVTFEYVMLDGVNDSLREARQLARLLKGRPAKVNLIPFNAFSGSAFRCSSPRAVEAFWRDLNAAGIVATIRRPRGDDIAAACGQLAGRVRDRQRIRLGAKLASGERRGDERAARPSAAPRTADRPLIGGSSR